MNGAEDEREDPLFERLQQDGQEGNLPAVLHEVLDQLLVVDQEEGEPTDREDDQGEEEEQHEDPPQLVEWGRGVEEAALREEVEGELLYIPLEQDEDQDAVEGVLADEAGDAEVEEQPEEQREGNVEDDDPRQLEEEELQVVGEETDPVLVFLEEAGRGILLLAVQTAQHVFVGAVDSLAEAVVAVLDEVLEEAAPLEGHCVDGGEQPLGEVGQVLAVVVVELQAVEGREEPQDGRKVDAAPRQRVQGGGHVISN